LGSVRRLDSQQRRSFIAATVGLLAVAGVAGVILGRSYIEVKETTVGVPVQSQEPDQGARELERARGLTPQVKEETHPPKEEPESLRKQRPQAVTEAQEPPPDPEQIVALQRQVDTLQEELSAARQKLRLEGQGMTVREEATGASGKDAGELQRRIEELERTLAEYDYFRLVNEALAYTYRNDPGDAERAEVAYRNAIRIARGKSIRDPVVFNAYAAFLQHQRRFREAEQFYQMALELNPGYGRALYNLGSLYELTGRLEEALKKYKAADEAGEKLGAQSYSRLQSLIK
jgi:tetratricopeptide (TPR) repeat protein